MNTQFNSNVIWLQLEYKISTLGTKGLCAKVTNAHLGPANHDPAHHGTILFTNLLCQDH